MAEFTVIAGRNHEHSPPFRTQEMARERHDRHCDQPSSIGNLPCADQVIPLVAGESFRVLNTTKGIPDEEDR